MLLFLTFSGGGTRAAALSYGVLEELKKTEVVIDGKRRRLLDEVYLQQDAFDAVDISMPRERQTEGFNLLKGLIGRDDHFKEKDDARGFFRKLAGLYKNWNYSRADSPEYKRYRQEIEDPAAKYSRAT
jgi:V/A-type H+-transporting ATPase subunit A